MLHDTALPLLRQRSAPSPLTSLPRPDDGSSPRSLYAHIPFCFHKCHYCDFYSIVDSRERQAPFTDRLSREIETLGAWTAAPLRTIFIGGGTPTLLAFDHWQRLLERLHESFTCADQLEFTVECNPETPSPALFDVLVSGGVNRLSIGAQSFNPAHLHTLERWHDPDSVARAVSMARGAGIDNLSLDLIHGIPGQSLEDWLDDLDHALDLEPAHLSCYCLTYEPGTALTKRRDLGRIVPAHDDLTTDMQLACLDRLRSAGFERYEVSNYARPGHECRHNLAYWRQEDWLAAGPSASAHVAGHRWKNVPHLDHYLSSAVTPVIDHEPPDARRALIERLMTGCRIAEGIDARAALDHARALDETAQRRLQCAADDAGARGWLHIDDDRWRPTDQGFLFADALAIAFMRALDPEDPAAPAPPAEATA